MANVKKASFNLDEEIYYQIKQIALDERITMTKLLTKWTMEGLEKELIRLQKAEKEQKKLQYY